MWSGYDLSVVARGGQWVLVDAEGGELGAYESPADALDAVGAFAAGDGAQRHVLIQDAAGDWEEVILQPPTVH